MTSPSTIHDAAASVEQFMKNTQESVVKNLEQVMTAAKEQVEKASKQAAKGYGDLAALNKGNVEAVIASSTIIVKGLESLGKSAYSFAQTSMESGVSAGKAALTVKTLKELVDLQSDFARKAFDSLVAESTRMSEMSVKLANEAFEPIGARVTATVETLSKPVSL